MNRLVCERKVNDPVDCLLEVKEQSSRTHGGVRGSPHQSLLVGQSTRLWAGFILSHKLNCCFSVLHRL